jgi:hypothetical protein
MSEFTHNLDELMYLSNQKCTLTKHLEKNAMLISLGNKFIRYNPNVPSFDLSNVLRDINIALFSKP